MITTIAFDADDTLWHTESLFVLRPAAILTYCFARKTPD